MSFTRDFRDAHNTTRVVPGSPLALELAESASQPWGTVGLETAISVASLKLMIAAWDHLGSIAMLLSPNGMTLFGHTVLGRATVEAASRAHWILEGDIGPRRRVARAMTERLSSAREAAKVEKGLGRDVGQQRHVEEILTDGAAYGLQRRVNRNGDLLDEYEEHRPSATDAASKVLASLGSNGGALYGYMSAFIHGADYAVLQHLADAGPGNDEQRRSVQPVLPAENLGWVIAVAVSAHSAAYDEYVTLHGWPRSDWEHHLNQTRAGIFQPDVAS